MYELSISSTTSTSTTNESLINIVENKRQVQVLLPQGMSVKNYAVP